MCWGESYLHQDGKGQEHMVPEGTKRDSSLPNCYFQLPNELQREGQTLLRDVRRIQGLPAPVVMKENPA